VGIGGSPRGGEGIHSSDGISEIAQNRIEAVGSAGEAWNGSPVWLSCLLGQRKLHCYVRLDLDRIPVEQERPIGPLLHRIERRLL
jgi:hypothetical protein